MLQILFGGRPIDSGTFEENRVDDGARLSVIVPVNPLLVMASNSGQRAIHPSEP